VSPSISWLWSYFCLDELIASPIVKWLSPVTLKFLFLCSLRVSIISKARCGFSVLFSDASDLRATIEIASGMIGTFLVRNDWKCVRQFELLFFRENSPLKGIDDKLKGLSYYTAKSRNQPTTHSPQFCFILVVSSGNHFTCSPFDFRWLFVCRERWLIGG